ncbi:hypothetical protein QNN00_13155 [Bacillus velezensis]|nr:hypothetical protein [Bacillus velezensis]
MACHFPKAGDIKEFWKNLRSWNGCRH